LASDRFEEIKQVLIKEQRRSVTIYKGQGGLSSEEKDILYCVVTRLEVGSVKTAVKQFDPNAFIIVQAVSDAEGGIIKKADFH